MAHIHHALDGAAVHVAGACFAVGVGYPTPLPVRTSGDTSMPRCAGGAVRAVGLAQLPLCFALSFAFQRLCGGAVIAAASAWPSSSTRSSSASAQRWHPHCPTRRACLLSAGRFLIPAAPWHRHCRAGRRGFAAGSLQRGACASHVAVRCWAVPCGAGEG